MPKHVSIYFGTKKECEFLRAALTETQPRTLQDVELLTIADAGGEFGYQLIASGAIRLFDSALLIAFAESAILGARVMERLIRSGAAEVLD